MLLELIENPEPAPKPQKELFNALPDTSFNFILGFNEGRAANPNRTGLKEIHIPLNIAR